MINMASGADDHCLNPTATSKPCKLAFLVALSSNKTFARLTCEE